MMGTISRVSCPGIKFESMLCLVGGQGAGKSTFLRFLAMKDDWFTDDLKKMDDDNVYRKIQAHLILEFPEMVAILNAKNVEDTKSFMSRQKDTYKTPYDRHPKDHKRQCVFAGSSNSLDFCLWIGREIEDFCLFCVSQMRLRFISLMMKKHQGNI